MVEAPILEARRISKSYPGVQALDSVDFDLRRGEVHALVGQNGAGKSTLIEIIAGSLQPDSGELALESSSFSHLVPSQSIDLGIQTVHQEIQLVDELTVAENIYLYNLPRARFGLVNHTSCQQSARGLLDELGISVRVNRRVRDLTFIDKKLVSIAKALSLQAKILILDEPTASLDNDGKNILFDVIRNNAQQGRSVLYISHNLGEIFEVCDRVTVLKDGKKTSTHLVRDVTMNQVIHEMIGRESSSLYIRENVPAEGAETEALQMVDYFREGVIDHVSFGVRRGEIFGLGGLVGSGRTELARMIFGLDPKDSGRLMRDGVEITPKDPYDAIQKGMGYLTEDRKEDGLLLERPVVENISLARLATSLRAIMNLDSEQGDARHMVNELGIKTPTLSQVSVNLSGGNQQKVVIAKWLYAECEILIFDEPTVGVDVGAKAEIYRILDSLPKEGKFVLMISSDNLELAELCDRVAIMREGRMVRILEGADVTEGNILRESMGVEEKE